MEPSLVKALASARYKPERKPQGGFFRQYPDKNDLQINVYSDRYRFFGVNFDTIEDDLGPEVAKWFKDNMPELKRLGGAEWAGQPTEAQPKHASRQSIQRNLPRSSHGGDVVLP
jgi:hypothetical protein